jgi:hypothetical protein
MALDLREDYHFYHDSLKAGLRFCPNPTFGAVLFVVFNEELRISSRHEQGQGPEEVWRSQDIESRWRSL